LDETNIKANYRYSTVLFELKKYDQALEQSEYFIELFKDNYEGDDK